jgi:putative ABC transport system permease protein
MIRNILKVAFRNIIRNKIYTLINIFGLSAGLTAVLLIFLYVNNEYKYDSFLKDRGRIFRLESSFNTAEVPTFPGHILMQESQYCEKVVRVYCNDFNLTYKNNGFSVKNSTLADSTFFDIFNFDFLLGNPKEALKVTNSLVLTESLAKSIFGKENPMGKTILVENAYSFTITGVIKDPKYFHLPFSCIGTIESLKKIRYETVLEQFDGWSYYTYILGKRGISESLLQRKVNDKLMEYDYKYFVKFKLSSLNDLYLNKPLNGEYPIIHGNKTLILILISIAILILVIACINFMNISTSRASERAREIGIRKTIGASRTKLIIQFIFEAELLVFISLLLALTSLELIKPYFIKLIGKEVDFSIFFTTHYAPFVLGFAIFIGFLAGLYPAFYLSNYNPAIVLKGKLSSNFSNSFLKNGLVVFQYIIAIALISSTMIIYKQLTYLKSKDLGFNKEHLVYIKINKEIVNKQDLFKAQILNIQGVNKASYSGNIMGTEWGNWQNDIGNKTRLDLKSNVIDPDYLETMGIALVEGRNLRNEQSEVNSGYIINEKAVKEYDLQNVIGTPLVRGDKPGTIIGVVRDFNYLSPRENVLPTIFYYDKVYIRYLNVKIANANISATLNSIKTLWEKTCPAFEFDYHFADKSYDMQYKSDEMAGNLIGIGSLLAIVIACLGIYSLAISSSENRTKEIGIRKINGAKITEIVFMLNQDFLKLVAVAYIISCPFVWVAANNWLQSFAIKTELDWWIFALAGIIAFAIASFTVSWQSWKAASRNPVEALRYE